MQDTGIGIAAEKLPHVFDAFTQADSSTTRHFGGTGLGLAISKRLIELMQGSIGVESELGKGSKFFFELPVRSSEQPWTGDSSIVELPDGFREMLLTRRRHQNLKILVAEDNPVNRTVALGQLEELGYDAQAVKNGHEVLAALDKSPLRPGADGLPDARARRLRNQPADPRARNRGSAAPAGQDHRDHRARHEGRPRALHRSRDGRLPGQTLPLRRPGRRDQPHLERAQADPQSRASPYASPLPFEPPPALIEAKDRAAEARRRPPAAAEGPPLLDPDTVASLEALGQKMSKDLFAKIAGTYLRTTPELVAQVRAAFRPATRRPRPRSTTGGRPPTRSRAARRRSAPPAWRAPPPPSNRRSNKESSTGPALEILLNEYDGLQAELREKYGERIEGA